MSDFADKKILPYLKSEDVPSDNSAAVKVAVAKNFDELITNNGKDTLIEFYAPWCGHCKKLTPIYEELGEAVSWLKFSIQFHVTPVNISDKPVWLQLKNEDIVITKMDATANDVPAGFDVRGFPTLYWLPKNDKSSPVRYEVSLAAVGLLGISNTESNANVWNFYLQGGRELNDFIKYISKHATDELKGYDRSGKAKSTSEKDEF